MLKARFRGKRHPSGRPAQETASCAERESEFMFGKKKKASVLPGHWFCPGCGLDEFYDLTQPTCPECGDALRKKGFCPVCERHWSLPAGALCPKHDLELEIIPEPLEPSPDGQYVPWVTAAVFPNSATAAILQGRLESEGIPTLLDGERMGTAGMYLSATRGVRLQVPADKVGDARIILDQKWSLPDDEKADFEDLL
jgi:Putative prokaryotic signal transducing protein